MKYQHNRHNVHSFRPIVTRRRDILLQLVRDKPGLSSGEVFKEWHRSQARKDAGLLAVHIEHDLEMMERMQILRTEKGVGPSSVRLIKKWFLKT